jgi:tetratricopeptide (TPR) repeat protein
MQLGRVGAFLGSLVLAAASPSAAAGPQAATKLWDTYVDAAAQAAQAGKYDDAVLLLSSALQVVDRLGPRDPRPFLSRWLLDFARAGTATDDAKAEAEAALADLAAKPPTGNDAPTGFAALASTTVDETLLPFGWTVFHLAETYNKPPDKPTKQADLVKAERLLELAATLERQGLWKDDVKRRGMVPFKQSWVLFQRGRFEESTNQMAEALAIWEQDSKHAAALARNSESFSVLPVQASENTESSYTPLVGLFIEAMAYLMLGDQWKGGQPEKARDAYAKAEAKSKELYELMAKTWPGHPNTRQSVWTLGQVYLAREDYVSAEPRLRRALELFADASETDDASRVAKDLAGLLRKTKRESEAAELERRYPSPTEDPARE